MTLTLKTLNQLCEKYGIPEDVQLYSDSGWECSATAMCEAYYNRKRNVLVFTQKNEYSEHVYEDGIGRFDLEEELHPEDWKYLKP